MTSLHPAVRRLVIGVVHSVIICVSQVWAFLLRFDFVVPPSEMNLLYEGVAVSVFTKTVVFALTGLHRGWWKYVGMADLLRVFAANLLASGLFTGAMLLLVGAAFPRSVYVIDFFLCFLLSGTARFAVRLYTEIVSGEMSRKRDKGILIYGAGAAGAALLREVRNNPSFGYRVIGFIDDSPHKVGETLMGVRVLGCGRNIPQLVQRYRHRSHTIDEVVIAMPSATGRQVREALANCRSAGVPCKILPGIGELLTSKVLSSQIRQVSVNDLLGREPNRLDETRIRAAIAGRVVLVTGAAGSIGSELCRQLAGYGPDNLVLFDQAESDLFRIDLELRQRFPHVTFTTVIGDIRDPVRLDETLRKNHVVSIFHAAAYKHVPLMECHPLEAIRNNVIGTWNLIQVAQCRAVQDFVMISSDKAVNPTSIMGVTKRVAELLVSAQPVADGRTKFVSVRFGNVLGSNGSVVPLFQQQIAAGGPVTVTHPDMRRYFMTIREAVQLVLQASLDMRGSEIFVLDMGEPVRIVDLARQMIRLSGFEPDEDIEIRFTGLRPGEKLFEELQTSGENMLPTRHEKIKIFAGPCPSREALDKWITELNRLLTCRDEQEAVEHLLALVPEYQGERLTAAKTAAATT